MSLGQKALGGFIWTLSSNIGQKIMGFAIGIILARLLTPKDYGLVAMLYIFFEVSRSIVKSGFGQALIRENTLTEEDKATVFYLNVFISLSMYFILWFSAPYIADFYENDKLIDLTRFMGLTICFNATVIVQKSTFAHELLFKKMMIISLVSTLLTGILGISLAYLGFGVWALAAKYVSSAIIGAILFYSFNPWLPKTFIKKESFKRLFGFGSKLFLSGLINTIYENVYKIIIGKYFSAATLGLYAHGQMYVQHLTSGAINTLQSVTYPILSKTKDDISRLKSVYRKIIMATSFIIFPLTIGLGVLAEPLILTLVGDKWKEAIPFLQILCVSGALYHLHSINLNILQVLGRSDLFLKLEIIKKIIITIAVIVGLQYGIWGLMIGQVISSYIALFINMYYTNKLVHYTYLDQFKDIGSTIFLSLPMIIILIGILIFTNFSPIINLIGGILLAILIYFTTAYISNAKAYRYIIELLGDRIPLFRKFVK